MGCGPPAALHPVRRSLPRPQELPGAPVHPRAPAQDPQAGGGAADRQGLPVRGQPGGGPPHIERGEYIVFRPEDDVLRAWRAAEHMAPLLAPGAATVKLVHTSDGVLIGASPLPAGERRIVEAVILNSVQVSDKARREAVKCPRCGQEGKVSVIVRVRHGTRSCTVIRHPAVEAAATAAEAILGAGGGGS
ncbi:MAG: hypothetical protein QXT28_06275 [Thermofilaceae archaeon]